MKVSGIALGLICLSTLGFAAPGGKMNSSLGVVQAPSAGSQALTLTEIPAPIRHAADVALSGVGTGFTFTEAQLDLDEVVAIYEFQATGADGRRIEVDVQPSGKVEEIEIQLSREEVPAMILNALTKSVSGFQPAQEEVLYEKSLRPSASGLLEVWYEFAGANFDVEIRSDAKQILIEPA